MLIVFLFCDSTNNVAKVVAGFSANTLCKVFIERALSVRKAFEANKNTLFGSRNNSKQ